MPWDVPLTETCFYHSWYLAVDMQFFISALPLVILYRANPRKGKFATLTLLFFAILSSTYLSYKRGWSINTFDGAAVSRYEIEAYAKPHVRAPAYLSGMYVAMPLPNLSSGVRIPWNSQHHFCLLASLLTMGIITFVTALGAYERRPCRYEEWPLENSCGSSWSVGATFVYTAFSRILWATAVCIIMHVCLGRDPNGSLISQVLSWRCWVPLRYVERCELVDHLLTRCDFVISHLSFAAYLIHPIVLFVWQLGDREKETFRLLTFFMDYISVTTVSFAAALCTVLAVELPFSELWKHIGAIQPRDEDEIALPDDQKSLLNEPNVQYGSLAEGSIGNGMA